MSHTARVCDTSWTSMWETFPWWTSLSGTCRRRRTLQKRLPWSCALSSASEESSSPPSRTASAASSAGIRGRTPSGESHTHSRTHHLALMQEKATTKHVTEGYTTKHAQQCPVFLNILNAELSPVFSQALFYVLHYCKISYTPCFTNACVMFYSIHRPVTWYSESAAW